MGHFKFARFPNQEIYIKLSTNVAHEDCLIIGSVAPPDETLISFLFLSHTLKKELAAEITAILPYLAYARQDKIKKGESLATSSIGEIFRASHISKVVTIDVHSQKIEGLFPLPVVNLSSAKIFAAEIKKLKLQNPTFVSPDEGGIQRTAGIMEILNIESPIAYMKKTRNLSGIHSVLQGQVTDNAVVVDDILDTGQTLLACCKILKFAGVKNIFVFVTHGLFTNSRWQRLFAFNVKRIYCTDTLPEVYRLHKPDLKILSIKPLLRMYADRTRQTYEQTKRILKKADKERQDFYLGEETG